jgi:hypothetical protein
LIFPAAFDMKRYGARFRLYAWLSVFFTLFSAVSPALAAAVLADRPAALGQMLGLPAPAAADEPQGIEHTGHHGHGVAPAPSDEGTDHRAHGIYCSFCLNATSTVAIATAPPALVLHSVTSLAPDAQRACPAAAAFHPFFRSRAPPPSAPFFPV